MAYMKDLRGKRALITGGSSGIGLAVACSLADQGMEVILLGRDKGRLERAASKVRGKAMTVEADVLDPSTLERAASMLMNRGMTIDILVNSAGIVCPLPLMEQSLEEVNATVQTNLIGTIGSCRAFIPLMNRPGFIANISSMAGLVGLYGYTAYSASKFGVLGFSEALSLELAETGIKVGTVFPPDTATPQLEEELKKRPKPLSRMVGKAAPVPPEKVAKAVIRGIIRGRAMIYPTVKGRLLRMSVGPFGPIVRWYLRGKLNDR